MKTNIKTVIMVLAFVFLLVGAVFAYNALRETITPELQTEDKKVDTKDGETETELQQSPDFTVVDYDGNEVKLSDLFGKPIVLNFWASWCPPCKSEMPEFHKVYEEMGDEVTFVMVDLVDGSRETVEKGKAYVEEQGFLFPVYFDTEGEAGAAYGISSIPTTIFINEDGFIVNGTQGAMDEEALRLGISGITEGE